MVLRPAGRLTRPPNKRPIKMAILYTLSCVSAPVLGRALPPIFHIRPKHLLKSYLRGSALESSMPIAGVPKIMNFSRPPS